MDDDTYNVMLPLLMMPAVFLRPLAFFLDSIAVKDASLYRSRCGHLTVIINL